MATELIQVRVPAAMKEQAEEVLAAMGMKMGEAIRVFLQQTINRGKLPFQPQVKTPNAETLEAMLDTDNGKTYPVTLEELRQQMRLPPK